MPTASRTVRLFVSSTFADFAAERDVLQNSIFPRIRRLCLSHGLRFQAIDLRWGVSQEAGLDNRTMRICLRELKRCQQDRPKPNFLILLGERYGWRPLPELIPADIFELLRDRIPYALHELLEWHKDQPSGAKGWYRLDDNAVPPVYELRPRDDDARWFSNVEKPIRTALEGAARQIELDQSCLHLAIGTSATEQEIVAGALNVEDAHQHVHAFFRTFAGMPQKPWPTGFVDVREDGERDIEALRRLDNLKARIEAKIGRSNIHPYSVSWRDGGPRESDLAEFEEQIYLALEQVVLAQASLLKETSPEEQEVDSHQVFGEERCRGFVGRAGPLGRILAFLESGLGGMLAVVGPAGTGKSALMAEAARRAREAHGDESILARFIGATPDSTNIISLLRDLVAVIRQRFPALGPAADGVPGDGEIPTEINPLINAFQEALTRPTARRPLILFLDALDQLLSHNEALKLRWLPVLVNPHVRIIISTALSASDRPAADDDPQTRVMAELERRATEIAQVRLEALSVPEGRILMSRWLQDAGRILQPRQNDAILQAFAVEGNPLWLRVAAGECTELASWTAAPVLLPTLPGLLGQVLAGLESGQKHGQILVAHTLAYLAASRHGLAEDEILDLLSADREVMADFYRRSPIEKNKPEAQRLKVLPVAVWIRLQGDLGPYLAERQAQGATLLGFYHRSLLDAVQAAFLESNEKRRVAHRRLADYFVGCAKGKDPTKEWETDSVRGFAECVFHLIQAGEQEEAAGLLTDFDFLLHKVRLGLLEGVLQDYEFLGRVAPTDIASRAEPWAAFFRERAHILRRGDHEWPAHKILLQLAVEHSDDSPITLGAEKLLKEDRCEWIWLRRNRRVPHAQPNPCLAVLEGHETTVNGVLELTHSRLLTWSWDGTLRIWDLEKFYCVAVLEGHGGAISGAWELTDHRLLSWGGDIIKTLKLWDSHNGECLSVAVGGMHNVCLVLMLADGRLLFGSSDGSLQVWDNPCGTCIAKLKGHKQRVAGVLELSDGRLISWSSDRTLRVWDSFTGVCLAILEGHTDAIYQALELTDGRLLSWGKDNTLRTWDSHNGKCLAILEGHTTPLRGAHELADGRQLSWSYKTLRVWDNRNGDCLMILEGHSEFVYGALELTDGRLLSWSKDKTLRLWDSRNGACLAVLEGHSNEVQGALELADGRLLSWSQSLRLWDSHSGACTAVLKGHTSWVYGAQELSNGHLLSWSYDGTSRLWDSNYNGCFQDLEGHTGPVCGVLELSTDRLVSWAGGVDHNLRVWGSDSGICLATLEGHTSMVQGTLELTDCRLLSWGYEDHMLRVWDSHSGACLMTLKGHTGAVCGALELSAGRLVSWARYPDYNLQVWDSHSGACLATLEGHTAVLSGVLELSDGRLISWAGDYYISTDPRLRLWDSYSGACIAILEGHTRGVLGALELADGRLLSRSWDNTLRVWDSYSGDCLAKLEGHTGTIAGQSELADGRLLSWSSDCTLRLWDSHSGACLMILEGHRDGVHGAIELPGGRILSRSKNGTLGVWDSHSGACMEVIQEAKFDRLRPEWLMVRSSAWYIEGVVVVGEFQIDASSKLSIRRHTTRTGHTTRLTHRTSPIAIADWNSDIDATARCLFLDGTAVVTLDSGQVCFLNLYHGNRRISLAELDALRNS